jgi:hypothetical protein
LKNSASKLSINHAQVASFVHESPAPIASSKDVLP